MISVAEKKRFSDRNGNNGQGRPNRDGNRPARPQGEGRPARQGDGNGRPMRGQGGRPQQGGQGRPGQGGNGRPDNRGEGALAETTVADREMAAEEERMTLYLHQN